MSKTKKKKKKKKVNRIILFDFLFDPSIEKVMQKTLEISTVIWFSEQNEDKVIWFSEQNDRGDFQRFLHRFCEPNIGSNKKIRINFFQSGP